jgi:hypothetical protein
MSTPRPAPQRSPNVVIHRRVRLLCDDVPMVIRPAPNHRIEQINHGFLLRRAVHLDRFPDAVQKRFYVFGRRLDGRVTLQLFTEARSAVSRRTMPVRHAKVADTVLDSARCEDLLS